MSEEIINQVVEEAMKTNGAAEVVKGTVREAIMSRLSVSGGKVKPVRKEGEVIAEKTILDQEYITGKKDAEYKKASLADMASRGEDVEDELDGPNNGLVKHTDAYLLGKKEYPVVVCKTSTEVLDSLKEGKYMAISFSVNFAKMDSESLETCLRDFQPVHVDLPRRRISNQVNEEGMIVVEPSLNGFKISCFLEDIGDGTFQSLDSLNQWIEDYQGFLLETTLKLLQSKGVDPEVLLRSQVSIGLIPRTRRKFESRRALEAGEGKPKVITKEIREESRAVAEGLNAQLELMPLTNQVVEFGCSVYTLEVTTKSADSMGWASSRSNISYFTKGDRNGRIVRISGSKRKIPLVTEMTDSVKSTLESLLPAVVTIFENCARAQLGIAQLQVPKFPESKKCTTKNVLELFDLPGELNQKIEAEYTNAANKYLNSYFQNEESRNIRSVLGALIQRTE